NSKLAIWRVERLRQRLEWKVGSTACTRTRCQYQVYEVRGVGMCRLRMWCCHSSLRWLQRRSCSFLSFSKPETFPDSVFIHEFNAGSQQSGLDRLYGLLGHQSSLSFKIDDRR